MKQPIRQARMVLTVGTAALLASFIFGKLATSHTNGPAAGDGSHTTHGYTYHGASQDYMAVPHPWSITYAIPGTDYYTRDMDRQRRWEDEERKDDPPAVPEWARTREITLASE